MPDQESPPGCTLVTGILTQKKTQPGGRMTEADLSGTKKKEKSTDQRKNLRDSLIKHKS